MNPSYLVEQAVISIRLGTQENEVELVEATRGVDQDDLSTLINYATRVELLNKRFDSKNLCAFTLPSENLAIGRLTPRRNPGEANSDELYFQCLVITPETFYHAGANPATIVHLALNTMRFALYAPGVKLVAFELAEGVASVKSEELRYAVRHVGVRSLVLLIQAILEKRQTFFVSSYSAYLLVGSLFNLLPIHSRRSLSFAVGFRFRNELDMKLIGATIPQRMISNYEYSVEADCFIDVRDTTSQGKKYQVENDWGIYLERVLLSNEIDAFSLRLAEEFVAYSRMRPEENCPVMTLQEVSDLGKRWLHDDEDLIEPGDDVAFYRDLLHDDWGDTEAPLEENWEETEDFSLGTPWEDVERNRDGEEWKENVPDYPNDNLEGQRPNQDGWRLLHPSDANDIKVVVVHPIVPSESAETGSTMGLDFPNESESNLASARENLVAKNGSDENDDTLDFREDGVGASRDSESLSSVFKLRGSRSCLNDQKQDLEKSALRFSGLHLSPFALLTGEYPGKNVVLRKLDSLVSRAIEREVGAREKLSVFWDELSSKSEVDFILRVRDVYLQDFKRRTLGSYNEETSDHTVRLLGLLDVIAIMI